VYVIVSAFITHGVAPVFGWEANGTSLLGAPSRRRENNMKANLKGTELSGFVWLMIGTSGGSFEHGNELTGSLKCEYFLV
jgi:hypothetical protein